MGFVQIHDPVFVYHPDGPTDPGFGVRPPTDPGYGRPGWSPVDPGFGHGGGFRPDNSLPWAPVHPGNKPPGRPILPPHADNGLPPLGGAPPHPWLPGSWQPIDPGFGKPPLWGWILGPDNGLPAPPSIDAGLPPGPPVHIGGGPSTPPGLHPGGGPIVPPAHVGGGPVLPPVHVGGGPITPPGHISGGPSRPPGWWVPTDPGYGVPCRPCPPAGGKPHPPIWAWVPDLPDFGGGHPGNTLPGFGEVTTLSPATATVLASGGAGDVQVSAGPGPWTVEGVPAWVTVTPAGGAANGSIHYVASQNTTGLPRQAYLKIREAQFQLNQGAV